MNKILVVDDDAGIRMFYEEELNEEGYEVVTCGNPSKLMALIDQERPDLIVMDIKFGGYNGIDLRQEIRNTLYRLPVILCTGYYSLGNESKEEACDDYVLKSSDLRELKAKIKSALEREATSFSNTVHEKAFGWKTIPLSLLGMH